MKHLLSLEALSAAEMEAILSRVPEFKSNRRHHVRPLAGQTWGLIFSKSSTRTRVSFEVGLRELGADVIFLNANDIQLGRGEPIQDTARVLGRMLHGAVIRTFAQADVETFALYSGIPTINALTDDEHPCQILTDMFTFEERRGESLRGKIVTYVGDAACNVPASWVFAAAKRGFELRLAAPPGYQPSGELLRRAGGEPGPARPAAPKDAAFWYFASGAQVAVTADLNWAATGADLLYTDVWVSMGKESEAAQRLKELADFQINRPLVARAKPQALVMHCLPAYRGKEIDAETLEAHADTIFAEAENRLHVQKAVVDWMLK